MKIAVTAQGRTLDDPVDPRFGRCAHFVMVETNDMTTEALANQHTATGGGAGIQAAQRVANAGADAVLTGNCGPNAFKTLAAAEITVITGASGTVRSAVESYLAGTLSATDGPTVDGHASTT